MILVFLDITRFCDHPCYVFPGTFRDYVHLLWMNLRSASLHSTLLCVYLRSALLSLASFSLCVFVVSLSYLSPSHLHVFSGRLSYMSSSSVYVFAVSLSDTDAREEAAARVHQLGQGGN